MKFRFVLMLLVTGLSGPALSAKSYYVSSSSGNDRNPGTKPSAPWRSLSRVNQLDLKAGDQVLLKSGEKFLDAGLVFLPDDQGTAANPIVVDIYDGTARAIIMAPQGQHGISIYNTGGLTVRNLHLLGHGPEISDATERNGVNLWCDLKDGRRLSGLRFEGLLVSWFFKGIVIGADDPSYSGFADVVISDCTVKSCLADGIVSFGRMPGSAEQQSHRNLQILRTEISKCYGDPTLKGPHSGSGIIMAGTIGGLIDQCVAHDNGGGTDDKDGGGPVGIWCWGCHGVTIQRCLVYNQKSTPGVQDGGGFDIDGGSTNCVIQYCYSYNNEGYGYLVCEFEGATPITGATVRYNISWNDGRARGQSGLGVWNGNPTAASCRDVVFHNNLVVCDETAGSVVKQGFESKPLAAAFYNNVFVRTRGSKLVDIDRHTDTVVFKGNLYWTATDQPAWNWGTSTYSSLAAWRSAPGQPETHGGKPVGRQADPRLTDLVHGFACTAIAELATMTAFLPLSDSPLINAGLDLTAATLGHLSLGEHDFMGTALSPGIPDIGPYDR
jgi:Right handed beta helix region